MELTKTENDTVQHSDNKEDSTEEQHVTQSFTKKHRQDGVWSWIVCLSASASVAISVGICFSYGVLLPVFVDYFKVTKERSALVGSLAMCFTFLFGPVAGIMVQRLGCRVTMIVGGLICSVGLFCSSLPNSLYILFVSYSLLHGFGSSLIFTSSLVVASLYFNKRRLIATGVVTAGQGLGVLMFGPIINSLVVVLGWRKSFLVLGGIMLLVCLLATTFSNNVEKADESDSGVVTNKHIDSYDGPLYRNPVLVVITASSCICMFGEYIPQVHIVSHVNSLGFSSDDGSKLYILFGLGSSVSRIATGLLCDVYKWINPRWLYQGTEYAIGIAIILSTLATQYSSIAAYFFFYGFFEGIYVTTLNIYLLNCTVPEKRPMAFGVSIALNALFTASGPPIAGLLADKFGTYNPSFYMAGAFTIVGATVPFVIPYLSYRVSKRSEKRDTLIRENTQQNTELLLETSI